MKALTGTAPEFEIKPSRRKTEETRGGFMLAATRVFRRPAKKLFEPSDKTHIWDTTAWLNLWEWNDQMTIETFAEYQDSSYDQHLSLY